MKRIALFGGSFNPPHVSHRAIASALSKHFDEVIILPCGGRPDKLSVSAIAAAHRFAMIQMTFGGLPRIRIELFDLENEVYTISYDLDQMFRSEGQVWHAVGSDLIEGGKDGNSLIQREWVQGKELWENCNIVVLQRPGFECEVGDLPPHRMVLQLNQDGASSAIKAQLQGGHSIDNLVMPQVAQYIKEHGLYR